MIFVREFPDRSGRHCVRFVFYSLLRGFVRFPLIPLPFSPSPPLSRPRSPIARNDGAIRSRPFPDEKRRKNTKPLIATRINWHSATALACAWMTRRKKRKKRERKTNKTCKRENLRRATRPLVKAFSFVFQIFICSTQKCFREHHALHQSRSLILSRRLRKRSTSRLPHFRSIAIGSSKYGQ